MITQGIDAADVCTKLCDIYVDMKHNSRKDARFMCATTVHIERVYFFGHGILFNMGQAFAQRKLWQFFSVPSGPLYLSISNKMTCTTDLHKWSQTPG